MRIGIDTAPIFQHRARGVGALGAHLLDFLLREETSHTFCLFKPEQLKDANFFSESSEIDNNVSSADFGHSEKNKNPEVVRRPFVEAGFSWRQLQDAFRLHRQTGEKSLDLFHAYFQWNLPLRRMKMPVVGHVYDLMPMTVRDLYLKRYGLDVGGKIRLYQAYLKFALKRVDRVFTISAHSRSDLARLTGFPRHRIHVVYPAPAPGMKAPEDEREIQAVRERFRLEEDYLLYVGGYDYRKNLETLLAAHARAREKDLPYPLVLAGGMESKYGQWIQHLVKEAGPRSGLRPIGHVANADLPALYAGARLVLYPSFYEGFGLPVIDAMACGAPVICSNAASLPEAAGDATVLLDPEDKNAWRDAILNLAGDEDRRQDLRERGFRHAAQFTWEKAAQKTIEVYEIMEKI